MSLHLAIESLFAATEVCDLHVNVGHHTADGCIDGDAQGEHVRRQFAATDLLDSGLKLIGLRTHYSRVVVPADSACLLPSVALNWTGIDPDKVAQELQQYAHPHPIVWFQSFCDPYHRSVIDAAYRTSIAAGGTEHTTVTHTDAYGRLSAETLAVLEIARDRGAVIATPHANWERSVPLIIQAVDMGLRVLWVHPDSRLIRTPLEIQRHLVAYGREHPGKGAVYVERAAVFLRDGKPGAYSAEQIVADVRMFGKEHIVFSSDLGRYKAVDPVRPAEGLHWYIEQLQMAGLTDEEARMGLSINPYRYIYGD